MESFQAKLGHDSFRKETLKKKIKPNFQVIMQT